MTTDNTTARLEYLRSQINAECISYGEIAELEGLAEHIEPGDVQLLEWAGVPETVVSAEWFLEGEAGWVYLTHQTCNKTLRCDPPVFLDDLARLTAGHACPDASVKEITS